jgi:hypothetical protein
MRVQVGRKLRVGPGDEVVIRGRLPASGKLGRLFVFASENGAEFSPYVPNVADALVVNGRPTFMTPLSLRIVGPEAARSLSFVADIDGFVCVMQEVDALDDPKAKIKMTCKVNPTLGWVGWFQRKCAAWQTPKLTS